MAGKESSDSMIWNALFWGIIVGFLGLVGGFLGPLLFMPEANQGPILGLILGPVGTVAGAGYGVIRRLQEK